MESYVNRLMLVCYCGTVATLWYRTELRSDFERREIEDWLLAMQWDEKHTSDRVSLWGREGTVAAVYSRDNAASTYGSATSIVDLRYSLCRTFVRTGSCYANILQAGVRLRLFVYIFLNRVAS